MRGSTHSTKDVNHRAILAAIQEVAPDFDVNEMQKLARNVLHNPGSLPKEVRRQAAYALLGLRVILEAAYPPGGDAQ